MASVFSSERRSMYINTSFKNTEGSLNIFLPLASCKSSSADSTSFTLTNEEINEE
ncbi:hypothetical protein HanRHA438_Chr17g0797381 [Helianthus annuus]|uniref:Uncharacterized protein n=1 Tax=Helianthus annuus TaxID=4232 RepID=A0A251RM68_HELAN|nr:hypothetical protein HanXRQr2_Chr17g0786741 [Helianthus annuus]KAJ0428006.1 hypothetical protein HanHA300_Chr17g0641411 [Helianthus annuus]KAJ0431983.1 hypothetical protein HanIR_Chr17g0854371 [Helianthus annuus]KAJ0446315.1 hypothetical protein HanHA89_Chr17g0692981 [Helianthus annuus]KAJ0811814.1 hypothetical protein HanPSC8_Chr17g0754971 [Helianthus annuus]